MEAKDIIKEHYKKVGTKGGKARAKKLSPERRKEIATKAIHARKIYQDKNK